MELTIPYRRVSVDDFGAKERRLHASALEAMSHSHSPYSNFAVACSVLFSEGQMVTGNNQENAAYPSGLCAERVALFKGKSEGFASIDMILVMARNENGVLCESFPCGGCRQVLMEYATQQENTIGILMQVDEKSFIRLDDARELLPFGFTKSVFNR